MKICAATGNAGKLRELRRILEAQGHEVVSQKELGITIEPEETGTTFAENALIKAETICKACGLPTIADDSGLCVDALGGAPGVYSARYCGRQASGCHAGCACRAARCKVRVRGVLHPAGWAASDLHGRVPGQHRL